MLRSLGTGAAGPPLSSWPDAVNLAAADGRALLLLAAVACLVVALTAWVRVLAQIVAVLRAVVATVVTVLVTTAALALVVAAAYGAL
jgi:hypothetical protein